MDAELFDLFKGKKTGELLRWLSEDPSRVYYRDDNGVSLLLFSHYFGTNELTSHILSIRKPDDIYEAVVCGEIAIVEQILTEKPGVINSFSSDGFTPLEFAAYFCRVDIARLLLAHGANPELPSRNSFSVYPLHSAVAANCEAIARMLLENGASANVRQQKDITPLHSAAHNGNINLVKLLISHGADTRAVTADAKTSLDMALEVKAAEIIELLEKEI